MENVMIGGFMKLSEERLESPPRDENMIDPTVVEVVNAVAAFKEVNVWLTFGDLPKRTKLHLMIEDKPTMVKTRESQISLYFVNGVLAYINPYAGDDPRGPDLRKVMKHYLGMNILQIAPILKFNP